MGCDVCGQQSLSLGGGWGFLPLSNLIVICITLDDTTLHQKRHLFQGFSKLTYDFISLKQRSLAQDHFLRFVLASFLDFNRNSSPEV